MKFIADLHIHSHFSRATSRDLTPMDLAFWAQRKGIAVLGTGDFTHPGWITELRENLVEAENGLFRLAPELEQQVDARLPPSCRASIRFVLSGEISCIYKRGGKTRKVHNLILLPDFGTVERLNDRLGRIGNLHSDGRPILGLDSRDLLEIVLGVSDRSFFIPAHIWTPWFSLFGSKSGFDLIEECFADLTPHIHALETGLSSDPSMNRLLSALDPYVLVSNSDAHSCAKLGREANLFETDLDYDCLRKAMTGQNGFLGTIEFFPEEGKYHLDGHRKCGQKLHPRETREREGLCPRCGKPLTIGVLHRVYEMSDREFSSAQPPFSSLIPLPEILSEILDCGAGSKKVSAAYEELLARLGPEIPVLMEVPPETVDRAGGPLLAEAIRRMRKGRVFREEGYDGEYGVIRLFDQAEISALRGQNTLFRSFSTKEETQEVLTPWDKPAKKTVAQARPFQPHLPDPVLSPLNEAQKEAVLFKGGHLLITAGPGTGKTVTLTHRIAYQLRSGVDPDQVLALTFTNKAAREMRTRLDALVPQAKIWATTFHAFCLAVLQRDREMSNSPGDLRICSESDAALIARQVLEQSGRSGITLAGFLRRLPFLKRGINPPGDLRPLFARYQQRLKALGMLDLDDLEVETLRCLRTVPETALTYATRFPHLYVDEYQDTSALQVEILKCLVYAHGRPQPVHLCAIGDSDQAIYGFRGADPESFSRFAMDFPGARTISLSVNYRSSQRILDAAAPMGDKPKVLRAVEGEGRPVFVSTCGTHREEAEMVVETIERLIGGTTHFSLDSGRVLSHEEGENLGFGDMAVLFRLNAQGDAFEASFSRAGIPYVRSGEKPLISRYPVDVIWRYLQSVVYPEDEHYRAAYQDILEHHGLTTPVRAEASFRSSSSPIGVDRVTNGDAVLSLIKQAVAVHDFAALSEEEENRLRRLQALAERSGTGILGFLNALALNRGIDHEDLHGDRVALMSLHASKGLEWPVVFIAGCDEGLLPCTRFGDRDDLEERRLLYVGMTRARRRLILSCVGPPSPFLKRIPGHLCAPLERRAWKPKKAHRQLAFF